MKSFLVNLGYKCEVLASRLQGIAFDSPSHNGEFEIVARLAPRIRLAIDGGANIGEWTQHLLTRSPGVHVTVVEPHPKNAEKLRQRFATKLGVDVKEAALAGQPGAIWFSAEDDSGTGSGSTTSKAASSSIQVNACTLEEVANEAGSNSVIDFVKLDIEGDEMAVLTGARKLFQSGRLGVVQLEYNCTWIEKGALLRDCFQFAQAMNYSLMQLTPFGPMSLPRYGIGLEDFRMRNLLLVRHDFTQNLAPFAAAGRPRVELTRHSRSSTQC